MHVEKPGLIVAPLTPFTAELDVDEGALRREIDYVVRDCRATMVVAAGVETQEYNYLGLEQRKALIRAAQRRAKLRAAVPARDRQAQGDSRSPRSRLSEADGRTRTPSSPACPTTTRPSCTWVSAPSPRTPT